MVTVLTGAQREQFRDQFEQLFRLRHQIFVKGRGWSLPSVHGDLEIDQYDDRNATYFFDFDEDGLIQGSVRMTPTLTSSLLADYYPHLVENGQSPRSPHIYEATRYIIRPSIKNRDSLRQAKGRLLVAVVEWCMGQNLTHLQTVIDSGALSRFLDITLLTTPLGLSHPYGGGRGVPGGGECLAFRWPIVPQVLDDVRTYAGFDDMAAALGGRVRGGDRPVVH